MEIIVGLGFLAVWGFILLKWIYKDVYLPKQYARDIVDKVRWIAIKSSSGSIGNHRTTKTVRDMELFEYIEEKQYELNVEENFRLDFSSEKNSICEILETHRHHIIESYFFDSLKKDKALYNLDYLEYYMWSLCCFLGNNSSNKPHGVTYYKLDYVVSLFCANNENIKPLFHNRINTLNNIKTHIEKEVLNVQRNTTL